jgi:hypothetical protein
METPKCIARVPDHTNTVDCGDPVLRCGLCAAHVAESAANERANMKRAADEYARASERLSRLLATESFEVILGSMSVKDGKKIRPTGGPR